MSRLLVSLNIRNLLSSNSDTLCMSHCDTGMNDMLKELELKNCAVMVENQNLRKRYAKLEKKFYDLQAKVGDDEEKVKASEETVRVLHENNC